MNRLFTEAESAEIVIERLAGCDDLRFRAVMEAAIRHLHTFVKEVEPTVGEWAQAIRFLTATGQMCDDRRQEWILASDVLGVSMLVETLNNRSEGGATEATVLGPFHVEGAPQLEPGSNICRDGKGMPCLVSGRVTDVEGRPLAGAVLDIWQTNADGFYDVQQPELQPEMNLRGRFLTDADGRYAFRTVRPVSYPVPTDGPVGDILRRMGRHAWRPAHIHFIASKLGYRRLVTHIFAHDDPYIDSDAVFGVKEPLLVEFREHDDSERARELGMEAPFCTAGFDIRLARED
ncbi:MAG: intradiol ring-cleavage dioxygenase [Alphaproteobacteria bacterium]|nr:intradiol ring-cleavage dioxygenase [Alphaproteobacteria bacterium]